MDAMVTARVPVEIKKQGDVILKEIGSSATELVNAAYDYLLKNKALPKAQAPTPAKVTRKVLRGKELDEFKAFWSKCKVPAIEGYDGTNFKEMLGKLREERDESINRQ